MVRKRGEVASSDKWNVEALYPNMDVWQQEFDEVKGEDQGLRWPAIQAFRGTLSKGPQHLKAVIEHLQNLERKLTTLYTYAHLRHDEDIVNPAHKEAYVRVTARYHDLAQEASWFEPELLGLSEETLQQYLDAPELAEYRFHIEKIVRMKKYTLSPEQEELIAAVAKPLQAASRAFSALNDADFKFGKVADKEGKLHELTHGSYGMFIRSQDRVLRANSFRRLHQQYSDYQHTLGELLNGQVQRHLFEAKARGFSTCVEAALYPKNIDVQVYDSLIKAVRDNIDALHDYMALRKELLGVEELHMYDLYVPLTPHVDIKMNYQEAQDAVISSTAALGEEYQSALREGLEQQRWVDRYENENKRSGAYSSGCYDSMPYILMNFKGVLRDVFTLAHEAGHSMHSLCSRRQQPYHYSGYPIFVAEVASTFNEELLMKQLVARTKTQEERIFLIVEKLEDIRTTLFRQAMFAEFERKLHHWAENDTPLTTNLLNSEYSKLNKAYFGTHVVIDPELEVEWSRIPHFYYNFYVYQYATGISAAIALADRVTHGGAAEREAYLNFLKGGCSRYPLDLLQMAGVDMRSSKPVEQAIGRFRQLLAELRTLTAGKKGSHSAHGMEPSTI
ncbi:MAG: oligoendopeptidase F [Chlamydiales bacterium]|nr:oligoendopeptidase F [Chlamydiales bacterium]